MTIKALYRIPVIRREQRVMIQEIIFRGSLSAGAFAGKRIPLTLDRKREEMLKWQLIR